MYPTVAERTKAGTNEMEERATACTDGKEGEREEEREWGGRGSRSQSGLSGKIRPCWQTLKLGGGEEPGGEG
jgi:hypothetical protein